MSENNEELAIFTPAELDRIAKEMQRKRDPSRAIVDQLRKNQSDTNGIIDGSKCAQEGPLETVHTFGGVEFVLGEIEQPGMKEELRDVREENEIDEVSVRVSKALDNISKFPLTAENICAYFTDSNIFGATMRAHPAHWAKVNINPTNKEWVLLVINELFIQEGHRVDPKTQKIIYQRQGLDRNYMKVINFIQEFLKNSPN